MTIATKHVAAKESGQIKAHLANSLAGDGVPSRVLLTPWGSVESTNGSFIVDEESARLVVAAFEEHGTDLPIDYEHQTLGGEFASHDGQAPAAGWIKRVLAEPGVGLLAEIEWTDQAAARLVAKEYRYLSPVAIIRKSDRKLVALHSAALTNKPAIVGMTPIVNRAAMLNDCDGATELARLRVDLGLDDAADPREVLVAASRRLEELRRDSQERFVAERIRAAMAAGKLVEAQRSWAESLVAKEQGLFEEWLRTAPIVVMPGCSKPPGGSAGDEAGHHGAATRARAEFRAQPLLARLTTEDAYVSQALRAVRN